MAKGKVFRRLILSTVIFILLCGIVLYALRLTVGYRPAAYSPRELTVVEQQEATERGLLKYNELYNTVHMLEPFSISIEQSLINDLMLTDDTQGYWQQVVDRSGGRLGLPQLVFEQGIMSLMVLVDLEEIEAVITLELLPEMDEAGLLQLSVGAIRAGAMPLPKSMLQEYLSRAVAGLRDQEMPGLVRFDEGASEEERLGGYFGRWAIPALVELVDEQQVTVPTEVPIDVDRWARIMDVRVGDGIIEFDLEPYVDKN